MGSKGTVSLKGWKIYWEALILRVNFRARFRQITPGSDFNITGTSKQGQLADASFSYV